MRIDDPYNFESLAREKKAAAERKRQREYQERLYRGMQNANLAPKGIWTDYNTPSEHPFFIDYWSLFG